MTAKNLDQNSFPIYAIQSINDKYFVCAGGGGAAKTGVKNAIVSYINLIAWPGKTSMLYVVFLNKMVKIIPEVQWYMYLCKSILICRCQILEEICASIFS